jgi:hypothetical protein
MNVSSIDPFKRMAVVGGWDPNDKSDKARLMLSSIKQIFTDFNDYPTQHLTECYNNFVDSIGFQIMFVHIREPSEIKKFLGMVKTKSISLLILPSPESQRSFGNPSDDSVNDYKYDYLYSSYNDAEEDVIKFFEQIIAKELGGEG